jgi:hypothetical protein
MQLKRSFSSWTLLTLFILLFSVIILFITQKNNHLYDYEIQWRNGSEVQLPGLLFVVDFLLIILQLIYLFRSFKFKQLPSNLIALFLDILLLVFSALTYVTILPIRRSSIDLEKKLLQVPNSQFHAIDRPTMLVMEYVFLILICWASFWIIFWILKTFLKVIRR